MTDQKDNQAQPTEISDDDLDGAQGGTIGNQLSVPTFTGSFDHVSDPGTDDSTVAEFPISNFGAGGGGSSI